MIVASLEGVTKRYADRTVLDGVTLGIDDRDRVGVIGHNGSGKSTLLRLLAGVEEPDAGNVVHGDPVDVRYLPQEPGVPGGLNRPGPPGAIDPHATPLDVVLAGPATFDPLTDRSDVQREQRARAMLDRLGVGDVDAPIGHRSGGQRKRIALAAALAEPCDLLVLDEPTNHLDVEIVEWLEDALRHSSGALVMVTHDRYLLDTVSTRIVEVEGSGIRTHHGSYADYLEEREAREARREAENRKLANRARTELAWLRRGPKARTSKAKARVEQARGVVETAPESHDPELAIDLPARRLGGKVVNLHNAGVRFGDRWVLRHLDLKLAPRDRIGVVGPNGGGKTTLLRLLGGFLAPEEGSVRIGETVHVGYYGQELGRLEAGAEGGAAPEAPAPRTRVLDAVTEVVREAELTSGARLAAGQLLERFLFPPVKQKAHVEELSGGERRRLELLRVLGRSPNLLLLDEPTNDLDLDTLAVLEAELDTWAGTVVVASHDRFFLDRVCEHLYAVEPAADGARVRHHPGGWSAYRARERERAARDRAAARTPTTERDARPRRTHKRAYHEQRELEQLGERIPQLEARKAELAAALQEAGDDYEKAAALGAELAAVTEELDAAETRWLELAEIGEC